MIRKYKRTPGSRKYADVTTSTLEECLNAIRSGEMSQRQAADQFNISRWTIKRRLKNDLPIKPGLPSVFTSDEEIPFASHLDKVCDFGFPVDELVFRYIVKCHLEKQGRFANNVKRARAAIDDTVMTQYVDSSSDLTKDVPPDRIYNYDETCMSDDPGRSKIICRRGYKYPESVINSTKSTMIVMFCGNAAGLSIPPYIVYKAEHLWTTWVENGPMGTRYNRTSGNKIVFGDHLTSHLSLNVVKLCEENDIKFVCFPPNSSHLTQPLDIAYFRPLKAEWRDILTKWKHSEAGKRVASLPKDLFPMLLKTVLDEIQPNLSKNLKAGFKKAGVFP
ncbi:hypothetical protein J437_LFUL011561 [Ladona fulva]|uniref:DDE-1 domain-containing protein n=1 Tax=Ladona fulva TaxID=123851 RepID=A0A8K0KE77_LADFU|nr:hypothetical protein J437_LFUL011561 [Ladona fulva]